MAEGGSIDEKLAPREFVSDFVWAARTVFAQPSVAFVSIGLWVFLAVLPLRAPHDTSSGVSFCAQILVMIFYPSWCGAERLFFLRQREGKAVTLSELLNSTYLFLGRFLRLGLLVLAVILPPLFVVVYLALSGLAHTRLLSHAPKLIGPAVMVPIDFALTFVPAALVFTTRSARQAVRIGVGMIRRTWPRSGLYVLCPPLALNMLNAIYPTDIRIVRVVTSAALALLALLAKGATAAFYLRERPASSEIVPGPR